MATKRQLPKTEREEFVEQALGSLGGCVKAIKRSDEEALDDENMRTENMDDDKKPIRKPISLILTTKEYHRILEAQHRSMTKSFAEFMRASALKEAARILDAETETKPAGV